jgi:multiple sugar transport system permease protein
MSHSSFRIALRFAGRLLTAFFFSLPAIWIIAAALHPPGTPLPRTLWVAPDHASLENFARLGEYFAWARLGFNSLWISLVGVGLTIVSASLVGFCVSLLSRRSQQGWVILWLALLMIPEIALWPTRFVLFKNLGWIDSPLALLAPAWIGASPFFILIYYRAFRRTPREIFDSARIDGAGILQSWLLVALPVTAPTGMGIGLLSFLFFWGDFTSPMLYLTSERFATLPLALQTLQQLARSDWSLMMAGVTIVMFIPMALFIALTPYFNRRSWGQ